MMIPHIFVLIFLTACAGYGQFREVGQLTSNNITALAGNGDTVWAATDRGLNYQISLDDKKEWRGFEADNFGGRFYGLGFGGGGAAALVRGDRDFAGIGFWHFDHKSGRQQVGAFTFSQFSYSRELEQWPAEPVGGVIFFDNKFWAAFKDGGMICYDPASNEVKALRPGEDEPVLPRDLSVHADKSVISVLSIAVNGDSLLVTTPSKLWYYNSDKGWSSVFDGDSGLDSGDEFIAAFTLDGELHSFVSVKNNGKEDTALYRLSDNYKWNNTPLAIFPAVKSCFYALFDNNQVSMFDGTEEKLSAYGFGSMLEAAGGGSVPKVNDILFLPNSNTESTGTLLIATSSGLYFSKSADPVNGNYPPMILVSYTREIKSGESYALPGIIRGEGLYAKTVFVYRLKKSGNVTIRIYDYNMSHVKTVVNGARREAQARSTDPAVDFWDGTNKAGRRVSPGVYYYKITSTGGERFLGKVILAK